MFDSYEEVISTLKSLNDYYYIKSNFIICPRLCKLNTGSRELFCFGFLDSIEKKRELVKRLKKLEEREKTVLLLFYSLGKSIGCIGQELHLSCRHCYRIKNKALEKIVNFGKEKNVALSY